MGSPKQARKNRLKSSIVRRRESIRRRILRMFTLIGTVAMVPAMGVAMIFGHDLATQCDYFQAETISVQGTKRLTDAQVRDRAGVARGANVLAVNLGLARKRLLAHPWVADAQVRRELPRKIHIRIEEHRPLALLEMDGRRFLVSMEEKLFKEAGPGEGRGLPVVTGLGFTDIPLAGSPASPAYKAALALLANTSRAVKTVPGPIQRLRVDRECGVTLFVRGPVPSIRLGYGAYPEKFRRLRRVMGHLGRRMPDLQLTSIDLTDINRIVIAPAGQAPPKEV